MTPEEFKMLSKQIKDNAKLALNNLEHEYISSINPYPIGSIFTDNIGSIKVERLRAYTLNLMDIPTIMYSGLELKKDGTPKLKERRRAAFLINEIK